MAVPTHQERPVIGEASALWQEKALLGLLTGTRNYVLLIDVGLVFFFNGKV